MRCTYLQWYSFSYPMIFIFVFKLIKMKRWTASLNYCQSSMPWELVFVFHKMKRTSDVGEAGNYQNLKFKSITISKVIIGSAAEEIYRYDLQQPTYPPTQQRRYLRLDENLFDIPAIIESLKSVGVGKILRPVSLPPVLSSPRSSRHILYFVRWMLEILRPEDGI